MHPRIRTLLAAPALALAALAVATPDAGAQVQDPINVGAPLYGERFATETFGWSYTPLGTFSLTGVFTRFAEVDPADLGRTVWVDVYDGSLQTPLGSASFLAGDALGGLGGATFAQPITLTGGTTYFIGLRNVLDLGTNLTTGPRQLATVRFGDLYEFEASLGDFEDAYFQPVLELRGTPVASTVPEPGTVVLVATGLVGAAGVARRRRR